MLQRRRSPGRCRPKGSPLLAALFAAALGGHPARAETTFQATGATSVAWSRQDNSGAVEGAPVATAMANDFYTDLRPGLLLQLRSLRTVFRATYVFTANLNFVDWAASNYGNNLALMLALQPTARTTLTLNATGNQGNVITQRGGTAAEVGQPALLPSGNPDLITVGASEVLTSELTARRRFTQRLTGAFNTPIGQPDQRSYAVELAFSLEQLWRHDALGGELRTNYNDLGQPPLQPGTPTTTIPSLTDTLLLRWRRDLSPRWNALLSAGATQAIVFSGNYPVSLQPAGTAILSYLHPDGTAALNYTHGTMSDVITGTLSITDLVSLRGSVLVGRKRPAQLSASAGYAYSQPIGGPAQPGAFGSAIQGDAGFSWQVRDQVILTGRYGITYQFGQTNLPPMLTQLVMLGITARYSSAPLLAAVPGGGPSRVDRAGEVPFPSAHEPPPVPPPPAKE